VVAKRNVWYVLCLLMRVVTDVSQALARALYSRPRLALFDDPLSSLDNKTAQQVFSRVFGNGSGLLRQWGTTVILVTHAGRFPALTIIYQS
jgi:predicted ABC-type transport system involved in lysophospholipase L1 biosynthesis ATPase subunit